MGWGLVFSLLAACFLGGYTLGVILGDILQTGKQRGVTTHLVDQRPWACSPLDVASCPSNYLAKRILKNNWASEASPTLGCSIEISRDIYIYVCRYVCLSWSKKRRRNYVGQTRACSKSVLCGKIRQVTPVLLISIIRYSSFSMEMRNLKQKELHRLKNRGKKG